MSIKKTFIAGAQLCALGAVISIFYVPVEAADTIAVPSEKPQEAVIYQTVNGIPIPQAKPGEKEKNAHNTKESVHENTLHMTGFKAANSVFLSVTSLFSTEDNIQDESIRKRDAKNKYPHGYVPMSADQSKLYAKIFEMQALGKIEDAIILQENVQDYRLLGHVLAQRYLHPAYKTSYQELQSWLDYYADHPDAPRLHKLALARKTVSDTPPKAPTVRSPLAAINEPGIGYGRTYHTKIVRGAEGNKIVSAFVKNVLTLATHNKKAEAIAMMKTGEGRAMMDAVELDILQTNVAERLLYNMDFNGAYVLARESADRAGKIIPKAHWVAGLAKWQKNEFDLAATQFDKVATSPYASGWLASAGAFWAARSYKNTGNHSAANQALETASQYNVTFYGIMAMHMLGRDLPFDWSELKYSREHEKRLLATQAGHRAMSLVAAQQYDKAEAELLRLPFKQDANLQQAALAYAKHVGLPAVASRLGTILKNDKNSYYYSALYPVSPWEPENGYKLDPALVHAIIRQESRFDQSAISHSGALGLMQVMPKTAHYVAQKHGYGGGFNMAKLVRPSVNMKVGQDYVDYLLNSRYVQGNVVELLIAYNAGPGNLLKWRKRLGDNNDPLLLIEMLPVKETRDYAEKVLANYWIYRHRAGLELHSLAAIANGKKPKYAHVMQDVHPYQLAGR